MTATFAGWLQVEMLADLRVCSHGHQKASKETLEETY